MIDPTNPSWWASISAAAGATVAAVWGRALGDVVQTAVIVVGGLIVAAYVVAHNWRLGREAEASAIIGGARLAPEVAARTAAATAAALASSPDASAPNGVVSRPSPAV